MSSSFVPTALREQVNEDARRRCGYCQSQEAIVGAPMEIDHIAPRALGGLTVRDNLWLACTQCNRTKGNRTNARDPVTEVRTRLFNPRLGVWSEHFSWTRRGVEIEGRTAIGRTTVDALDLNRPTLIQSRRRWIRAGWHPPQD
jgi:hypothetical protein